MNFKFSFIIPVYNCEQYIERCIDSIINQEISCYEIIAINDGSTDRTLEILKQINERCPMLKIINQKNHGVSYARNVGLKESNGDYIIFIDADDFLEKRSLTEINKIIKKYDYPDIIKFSYYMINKFNKKIYTYSIKNDFVIKKENYKEYIFPYIFSTYDLSGVCSTIFSKKIIDKTKFKENIKYGEDMLFINNILKKANTIVFSSNPVYNYFENIDSATNKIDINKSIMQIRDNIEVFDQVNKLFKLEQEEIIKNRIVELIKYKTVFFANGNYKTYRSNLEKLLTNITIDKYIDEKKIKRYITYIVFKMKYIKRKIRQMLLK